MIIHLPTGAWGALEVARRDLDLLIDHVAQLILDWGLARIFVNPSRPGTGSDKLDAAELRPLPSSLEFPVLSTHDKALEECGFPGEWRLSEILRETHSLWKELSNLTCQEIRGEPDAQAFVAHRDAMGSTDRTIAEVTNRVRQWLPERVAAVSVGSTLTALRQQPPVAGSNLGGAMTVDRCALNIGALGERLAQLYGDMRWPHMIAALHDPKAFAAASKTFTDEFRTEGEKLRVQWCELVQKVSDRERGEEDRRGLIREMVRVGDELAVLYDRTAKSV